MQDFRQPNKEEVIKIECSGDCQVGIVLGTRIFGGIRALLLYCRTSTGLVESFDQIYAITHSYVIYLDLWGYWYESIHRN